MICEAFGLEEDRERKRERVIGKDDHDNTNLIKKKKNTAKKNAIQCNFKLIIYWFTPTHFKSG